MLDGETCWLSGVCVSDAGSRGLCLVVGVGDCCGWLMEISCKVTSIQAAGSGNQFGERGGWEWLPDFLMVIA